MKIVLMGGGSRFRLTSSTVLVAALGATLTMAATPALTATIDNTATVSGYSPSAAAAEAAAPGTVSPDVTNTGSETITLEDAAPSFTLVESVAAPTTTGGDDAGFPDGGDTITYTYVFTNNGNTTIDGSTVVVDPGAPTFNGVNGIGSFAGITLTPSADTGDGELSPGESWTYTAVYTLAQLDVDNSAGVTDGISNTTTATASTAGASPVSATLDVPNSTLVALTEIDDNPILTIAKVALRGGVPDDGSATPYTVGETVTYEFTVANEGNVTMANMTVADTTFGGVGSLSAIACTISTDDTIANLAPGETETCTATYVIEEGDL